ncbi:MAG: glycosyltransferase family 29 protein, partial [Rubrivivax sp.]|nr:glycosyltransferase family 29 protein [Rubrivivax sp.]
MSNPRAEPQLSEVPEAAFPPDSAEAFLLALPQPIAIVGNGSAVRPFGALIDSYPSVLRLNNYVVEGFADAVGTKTTARVTSGWTDIEPRAGVPELTPFASHRAESSAMGRYRQRGGGPLNMPVTDIGSLLPGLTKPSTGLALLALCSHLGLSVHAYGFDGFKSGHYWSGTIDRGVHVHDELAALLGLRGVILMGQSFDYASLYDYCHDEHAGYNVNEGLRLFRELGLAPSGERIVEFGAGNGGLSAHLAGLGNNVTAVEVSRVAFERIPVPSKLHGDCLDLVLMASMLPQPFDRFVSVDVLEHLTENDVRVALFGAAACSRALLVSVSTRPSGLTGPRGENLHLTVKSVDWWLATLGEYFVVTKMAVGLDVGQMVFEGHSKLHGPSTESTPAPEFLLPRPPCPARWALPEKYVARPQPEYYVDSPEVDGNVTWQPDVYPAAAQIAESLGCDTLIDIGCGHGRKLKALSRDHHIIGVDFGPNIAHCRRSHPFGTWLEADLERPLPLPVPSSVLARSVVICSDVIEHLVDPAALLALLKELLRTAAAVVLSTPDRARTHGVAHLGPAPNRAHTREWTSDELGALLRHAGFDVELLTHTRSEDVSAKLATILAVLVNREHPALRRQLSSPAPAPVAANASVPSTCATEPAPEALGVSVETSASDEVDVARRQVEGSPTSPAAWLALAMAHERG